MKPSPKIIAVIPARWGSERFPGKALAEIAGVPMVARVLDRVMESKSIDEAWVATDDSRIMTAIENHGGKAFMTSSQHQSGSDRVAEVVSEMDDVDIVVNVQGDEPLMPSGNIDKVVKALVGDESVNVSTLKTKILNSSDCVDSSVVKVVTDNRHHALYFSRSPIPYSRDSWPSFDELVNKAVNPSSIMYKHLGIYAYRKKFLERFVNAPVSFLEKTEKLEQLRILEMGEPIRVEETEQDSWGVDRKEDVETILKLMGKN